MTSEQTLDSIRGITVCGHLHGHPKVRRQYRVLGSLEAVLALGSVCKEESDNQLEVLKGFRILLCLGGLIGRFGSEM